MSLSPKILILNSEKVLQDLKAKINPFSAQYLAFYSSWFGGILKDPGPLLLLPVDDHMVHRGDGVFEAIKAIDGKIYLFSAHLDRLKKTAEKIGLLSPFSDSELTEIVLETLRAASQPNVMIRIFLSRGPGAFSANPYDSIGAQLYVIVHQLNPVAELKYQNGVHCGRSAIPVKEGAMPTIKSCNYLPNVLMKKESVDRKLEFTFSFDADGNLAESATENVAIVDATGVLTHPQFDTILRGTTMARVFELASQKGLKTAVRNIPEADLFFAREILMLGTTLDVLPVTTYEGRSIGDGKVGAVAKQLRQLLNEDIKLGLSF